MKWGIIILLVLGVIAAASAALLVGSLRTGSSDPSDKNTSSCIEVATAKISMPAMTVITLNHITKQEISKAAGVSAA